MQLVVDVGNTRIKWGYWDGQALIEVCAQKHLGKNFDRLLHKIWGHALRPSKVWISNVADLEIRDALLTWIQTVWDITPEFLQAEKQAFNVINGYEHPEQLGVDRWLAMLAGYHHGKDKGPACIIDCGTYLTVDVVNSQGAHLGGLIMPGIQNMRSDLTKNIIDKNKHTAQNKVARNEFLGRTTEAAIAGGTLFCATAYIERMIDELSREFDEPVNYYVTGGEADLLMKLVRYPLSLKPHLVLEGLVLYAKFAQKAFIEHELLKNY